MILHTVPVIYEKHEDRVDTFAQKAFVEMNKQYAVLNEKVLQKIPRGPFKDKKLLWEIQDERRFFPVKFPFPKSYHNQMEGQ